MRVAAILCLFLTLPSCGEKPVAKLASGKEPLPKFLAQQMKGHYNKGAQPCAGCSPSYFLKVTEGLELHQKGEWEKSNEVLLKVFREDADQASCVSFFIALNHGMLGSYVESHQWGERALAIHLPYSWVNATLEDPHYGDLFQKREMAWFRRLPRGQ
jgi:hypothetical protein